MKFLYKHLVLIISVVVCTVAVGAHTLYGSQNDMVTIVARQGDGWRFSSPEGFLINSLLAPASTKTIKEPVVSVTTRTGTILVNDVDTRADGICLTPIIGKSVCADVTYFGDLIIRCDGERLALTHHALLVTPVVNQEEILPRSRHVPHKSRRKKKNKDKESSPLRKGMQAEIPADETISPATVAPIQKPQISMSKTSTLTLEQQGVDVDGIPLQEYSYKVRVLLNEQPLSNSTGWTVTSKNGFFLLDGQDTAKAERFGQARIKITAKAGHIYINGAKSLSKKVYIMPVDEHINFEGNSYHGAFLVTLYNGKILLVNSLDLEDYVHSVLRTESMPGWPLEVNKVFAITCRTYAMEKIISSRSSNLPYHIKNTNIHQTYSGSHMCSVRKNAVEETKGIFVSYKKKPILAMFDICCGGIVPAHVARYDFTNAPYLARKQACTYCESCKVYNWHLEYSTTQFMNMLKSVIPNVSGIKMVKVSKQDKAGLVQEVTLAGINRNATVSGKKMYSLVKGVKSCCFTIHKKGNSVVINGRGHGHQMGLCQWGARQMVNEGFGYKEILDFYYPGTSLMRLV